MRYLSYKNEITRSSVLAAVHSNSNEAWSRFFDIYAGFIFGIARSKGLFDDDANEIVQIVMIEVVNNFNNGFVYDRKKGHFRKWLGHLTNWRIKDFIRQKTHVNDGVKVSYTPIEKIEMSKDPEIDSAIEEEWRAATIGRALRLLQKEVSTLHFQVFHALELEEWPTEKVCTAFGITKSNAYQIRKRLRTRFDSILKQELENDGI